MNFAVSYKSSSPAKALRYLLELLEFLQKDSVYIKQEAKMTMAEIYTHLGDYSKAVQYVRLAIEAGWMPDFMKEYWTIENNYHLEAISGHEEFISIVRQFNRKIKTIKGSY